MLLLAIITYLVLGVVQTVNTIAVAGAVNSISVARTVKLDAPTLLAVAAQLDRDSAQKLGRNRLGYHIFPTFRLFSGF